MMLAANYQGYLRLAATIALPTLYKRPLQAVTSRSDGMAKNEQRQGRGGEFKKKSNRNKASRGAGNATISTNYYTYFFPLI